MTARHQLGQWFTPAPLARLMLGLALQATSRAQPMRVLDPCCGDGALLETAREYPQLTLLGLDVDATAITAARARHARASFECGDLLAANATTALRDVDIVIANPPWVSAGRADRMEKQRRAAMLATDWPALARDECERIASHTDLAALCVLRSLRLLRPGGVGVFALSTALLDAEYSDQLWRAIETVGSVEAILATDRERWFAEAAVTAMLVVVRRDDHGSHGKRAPVAIGQLREPTAVAANDLLGGASVASIAKLRHADAESISSWGAMLRASHAWFEFVDAAGDFLVPLHELADIRRGATSGANEFFYLRRDEAITSGIDARLFAPVVRAPYNGAAAAIAIDPDETPIVAICAPPDLDLRRAPALAKRIAAHAHLAERSSLRHKRPWWHLAAEPARLFIHKAYGPRYVQRLASRPMLADQRVYAVTPHVGVELELLTAVLNAVTTSLALESLGRRSFGFGAIEWSTHDLAQLPVLDVRRMTPSLAARLRVALTVLSPREVGHVATEVHAIDRIALDDAILAMVPSIERAQLWRALITSVDSRERAKLPALTNHDSSSDAARS